ncbi:MAG: PepSY domain-containing protein [Pseudomonadota bacterium]
MNGHQAQGATGAASARVKKKPPLVMELRKWHRWLTLALLVQMAIWVITAFSMTMIPRSATIAYRFAPDASFDAVAEWPETEALRLAASEPVRAFTLTRPGLIAQLDIDRGLDEAELWSADAAGPVAPLTAEAIAAHAAALTDEAIGLEAVSLKERNSPEYQKLPLPAWRVEADNAVLFFDERTGVLHTQTPFWRLFENWVTTIHVMDYTGNAQFRGNLLLTVFGLLFITSAAIGILAVRRVYITKGMGLRSLRWHQALGLVLALQVVFWTTSGLGVVWLLHPLRDEAHAQYADDFDPLALDDVRMTPAQLMASLPEDERFTAARIRLTQLLGQPVYQITGHGRSPDQALFNASTGEAMTLGEAERDQIAQAALDPDVFATIDRWEVASSPADLDFYFYTGPYPVWKGFFEEPLSGGVAIDQVTGYVHTPRTDREIFLERYYNVHVVNWRFGVVRYRQEPALIIVILLAAGLVGTGFVLHARRWRRR